MSIIIIDNTKPPSPILSWKPKPMFRSELERDRYWGKEKEKWINGVGEIPGTLYHKTQEQWIRNRLTGEIFRPQCRDVDLFIHQRIRDSRNAGEAETIVKGRGIGLSCEMGCLANYFMRTFPGSTSFFTSSEQTKISTLFNEKVMVTFNEYDTDIKPLVKRENNTKNSVYLRVEVKYKRNNGEIGFAESEVFCKETADSDASASGFSSKGAIFAAMDELFLHKRRSLLLKSSASCFIDQATGKVGGFVLAGGSVEETLSNEEIALLQTMIRDVQDNGRLGTLPARLTFIPAWMGKFMDNGHSNEKKAMEWWEKECESLSKMEDSTALRAFKMNNPMSLDDIFELTSGGAYEDDIGEKIKLQITTLKNNPPPILKCKLVSLKDSVTTVESEKPNVYILEQPKENLSYYLLVDGTATGSKTGNVEGSEMCGIVVKTFDPTGKSFAPVCIYLERPTSVEQGYINLINQLRYYNKFNGFKKISAEANNTADSFSSYLQREGLSKYIKGRVDLSGKGNSKTNTPFQYIEKHAMQYQYDFMNIHLRKYVQNIEMIMLLEDLLKPITVNADMRSAFNMLIVALGKDYDKPVSIQAPIKTKNLVRVFENGQFIYKEV